MEPPRPPEPLGERIARLEQIAQGQSQLLEKISATLDNQTATFTKINSIEIVLRDAKNLFERVDGEVEYLKDENRKRKNEIISNAEYFKSRFWVVSTVALCILALLDLAFRLVL